MPRHRLAPLALVILCALGSILLTGCTAIGFGIGALTDMPKGKRTADQLGSIKRGTSITIWMLDGRKLSGQFLGFQNSQGEPARPVQANGVEQPVAPHGPVVLLGTIFETHQLEVRDVTRVSVPVNRGKVIGLLTGLAIDALLVAAALAAASAGSV